MIDLVVSIRQAQSSDACMDWKNGGTAWVTYQMHPLPYNPYTNRSESRWRETRHLSLIPVFLPIYFASIRQPKSYTKSPKLERIGIKSRVKLAKLTRKVRHRYHRSDSDSYAS